MGKGEKKKDQWNKNNVYDDTISKAIVKILITQIFINWDDQTKKNG